MLNDLLNSKVKDKSFDFDGCRFLAIPVTRQIPIYHHHRYDANSSLSQVTNFLSKWLSTASVPKSSALLSLTILTIPNSSCNCSHVPFYEDPAASGDYSSVISILPNSTRHKKPIIRSVHASTMRRGWARTQEQLIRAGARISCETLLRASSTIPNISNMCYIHDHPKSSGYKPVYASTSPSPSSNIIRHNVPSIMLCFTQNDAPDYRGPDPNDGDGLHVECGGAQH